MKAAKRSAHRETRGASPRFSESAVGPEGRGVYPTLITCGFGLWLAFGVARDTALRLAVLFICIPVASIAATMLVSLVRRALRTPARRRSRPLSDAADAAGPQVVVGRLHALESVSAPRGGVPCAAYIERTLLPDGGARSRTDVGVLELDTGSEESVELDAAPWKVLDPFIDVAMSGEARLDEGAEVLVTARVERHSAAGSEYREGVPRYRLLAEGGLIAPLRGFSKIEVTKQINTLVWPVAISASLGGCGAVAMFLKSTPAPVTEAPAPMPAMASARPTADPQSFCGAKTKCPDGTQCDAEARECVSSLTGSRGRGEPCKRSKKECGPGLRCMVDTEDDNLPLKCLEPCRTDEDCPDGRWCLPCTAQTGPEAFRRKMNAVTKLTPPLETSTFYCVEPKSLRGAVGVVCDMTHGIMPPSDASGAAATPSAMPSH